MRTVFLVLAAGLLTAGCGQVVSQRAQIKVYDLVKPHKVLGFSDMRTYKGEMACGYVDIDSASPGLRRRRFAFDSIDNSAWIEGVTDQATDHWLYRRLDRRIWTRCMGLPVTF